MKSKTKRQFNRILLYALIFFFIAGTFLLYLPFTQSQPAATPVPVQNQPGVEVTSVPAQ